MFYTISWASTMPSKAVSDAGDVNKKKLSRVFKRISNYSRNLV